MNFDFTAEQYELKQSLRRFMQQQSPLTVARQVLEQQSSHSSELWQGLTELGVTGIMLPSSAGGYGLGAAELCIAAEEAGRQLAPAPLFSTCYLATQALLLGSDAQQQQHWLGKINAGSIATLAAPLDCTLDHHPTQCEDALTNLPVFDGHSLSGTCSLVTDAAAAEFVLVLAQKAQGLHDSQGNSQNDKQPLIWLLVPNIAANHVSISTQETLNPVKPCGQLTFNASHAEPLNGSLAQAPLTLLQRLRYRAAILTAFEQLGSADAVTEMAVEYAKTRRTFGRAIGSYQGIKHKLTDMYTLNQMARVHCYFGAWALELDSRSGEQSAAELAIAAASARVATTRALNFAAQEAIQVHGGMGYTWELDCQLFYRTARHQALILGTEDDWSAIIADQLELQMAPTSAA
ncbi:dehydrogenase [Shewanella sp. NFH-SH190041]|uniref:acyl-CoA dehydrogenase family protein n=1 Tax=Shewanella sp. NFH-SH190041 TaxID=2950245 RepID=UPI0021C2E176|nr:acyl-CoA dehydrogenase family protein [Shewanella sp. NFH-SH190041]BDM64377.1 dehydrogenase [Shewanella sp. NFH-SH190041]